MTLNINQFFNINQFPQEEGLLLWGISMNRIGNAQSASKNYEYLKSIADKIIFTEGIGLVTLYADYLYFNSEKKAYDLKKSHVELMTSHKDAFLNELKKDVSWIKKAFSFYTFGQMILDNSSIFKSTFQTLSNLYKSDEKFREYILFDVYQAGKAAEEEEEEMAVLFLLEELTLFYLFAKGKIKTNNEFIKSPEWVLQCYPGKPLKSEVYLFQQNPLKLENPKNKYEYCYYDLEGKILYDYRRLDIDTFDFTENNNI